MTFDLQSTDSPSLWERAGGEFFFYFVKHVPLFIVIKCKFLLFYSFISENFIKFAAK